MPPIPPKLIRDDYPAIIRRNGDEPLLRIAGKKEFQHLLREKMREELGEFLDSPLPGDPEELADLAEVIYATALAAFGLSEADINALRAAKTERCGGFTRRLVWLGNVPRQPAST